MANDPAIKGEAAPGLPGMPAGWSRVFDYRAGLDAAVRSALFMGPAKTLDAATAAIAAAINPRALSPSATPGSAIASISIEYGPAYPPDDAGDAEIAAPEYTISPAADRVSLAAHPALQTALPDIRAVDKLIESGDIETIRERYAGNNLALAYAALRVAGVDAYESIGYTLAVTRHYPAAAAINLAADYANVNRCFAWSAIRTKGSPLPASLREPKGTVSGSSAVSLSWRLDGLATSYQRRGAQSVTWSFRGAWAWAGDLYPGGQWLPRL